MSFRMLRPKIYWCLSRTSSIKYLHMNYQNERFKELCKYLNISENKLQYIQMKNPCTKTLGVEKIKSMFAVLDELGIPRDVLVDEPALWSMLPVTLKFRHKVLQECGILHLSANHILSYLPIMKQKTIGELKRSGFISSLINVENKLANYMTQWPTSLTTLVYGDVNDLTLYSLRLNIIQRYLELVLDLSEEEFFRGIKTYPTIKHRPLEVINETLSLLQTKVLMTTDKIKSNFYLIHADPENLKLILYKLKSIAGIDIKEILRLYPKIALKSYDTLMETRKVLEEHGASKEAQTRCFEIYTLGPNTVRERLEKAKSIPEFNTFYKHPRFLRMIYYNNKAIKRLRNLYNMNKRCLSLNVLSGCSAHYKVFEKAPGDHLGKGKDLVFCISEALGNNYSTSDIRKKVKRHPFWINTSLVQVKSVYEKLSVEFTPEDIYENCPILFYPWNKIRDVMTLMSEKCKQNKSVGIHELLNLGMLSRSQKLSLILYLLERNHYFTGNGIWNEENNKNIDKPLIRPEFNKSLLKQ